MNNLHILNLAKYEAPTISENKRNEWVTYGENNEYFNFLIERYKNSTTNNAIINNISRLIYGRGLFAIDANKKPNEYAQMMSLFNQDCLRKLCFELKALGQCAIQVHYSKDHKKILKAYHIPVQLLAPEKCNKEGEIEAYYYSDNWEDTRKYAPKRISAYGFSNDEVEILYVKPYSLGMKYFSYVDYQGAISYALLEEEVANYLINEVQNSFSGTKIVNFNNGTPTPEQQDEISSQVLGKLTGASGRKVIVSFNENTETRTTVEDIPLNDAPDHYTYLSEECLRKIMLGHNVTSPLLFGIASSNGFSSNADELKNSSILFDNMVIKPFQDTIIEALDKILAFNGISLKLAFRTLQPLEFTDLENVQTEEQKAEETGVELSKDSVIAQALIDLGEDAQENWILIDDYEVDYEQEDEADKEIEVLNAPKQSLLSKLVNLVSTGTANPRAKSTQDDVIDGIKFITRYTYDGTIKENSREFCRKMVQAGKLYRKEDILRMSDQVVNAGWGPEGIDLYSIWLYKGGGACHHAWRRKTFVAFDEKSGIDPLSPKAKTISTTKAEKAGYRVRNNNLVAMRPKDMPYEGFLPTNKRFN